MGEAAVALVQVDVEVVHALGALADVDVVEVFGEVVERHPEGAVIGVDRFDQPLDLLVLLPLGRAVGPRALHAVVWRGGEREGGREGVDGYALHAVL